MELSSKPRKWKLVRILPFVFSADTFALLFSIHGLFLCFPLGGGDVDWRTFEHSFSYKCFDMNSLPDKELVLEVYCQHDKELLGW
jgi:hypothetical protein